MGVEKGICAELSIVVCELYRFEFWDRRGVLGGRILVANS